MRIGLLLLLLASFAVAQNATSVRTVTSLPGTCKGGVAGQSTDVAVLPISSVGTLNVCYAPNTWGFQVNNLSVLGSLSLTNAIPYQESGAKWAGTSVSVPGGYDFSFGMSSGNKFQCDLATTGPCLPFWSTCAMSSGTTCTVTLPLTGFASCTSTIQGASVIGSACAVSGTTATVTAASSNSATWAVIAF